jgi:hypothetical protein
LLTITHGEQKSDSRLQAIVTFLIVIAQGGAVYLRWLSFQRAIFHPMRGEVFAELFGHHGFVIRPVAVHVIARSVRCDEAIRDTMRRMLRRRYRSSSQ